MTLVVDVRDWLDENGDPPDGHPRLRRRALRLARLIEYGGPLRPGELRETLVECARRPGHEPCPGLLWVRKTEQDTLDALCWICREDHVVISGWQDTLWAEGPMAPASAEDFSELH